LSPKVNEEYKLNKNKFILESAKNVFIRKGFFDTTMQDIVDECQISRGGLYRYFSSTEEIFEAIMEDDSQSDDDIFNKFMEMKKSAFEMLNMFIDDEKGSISSIKTTILPASYEFFIKSMRNNIELDFLKKRYNYVLNTIKKIIDYGIETKEFSNKTSSIEVSRYIITFIEGVIITSISVGIDEDSLNYQMDILLNFIQMFLKR
jgi:AcrR family transcriptional regulator